MQSPCQAPSSLSHTSNFAGKSNFPCFVISAVEGKSLEPFLGKIMEPSFDVFSHNKKCKASSVKEMLSGLPCNLVDKRLFILNLPPG